MKNYFDPRTSASQPGDVTLAPKKLHRFRSELAFRQRFFGTGRWPTAYFRQHLDVAAANPAIVVESAPDLLVAVYSSDIDGVAMLHFCDRIRDEYGLRAGDRLLSVNSYYRTPAGVVRGSVTRDLIKGPRHSGNAWYNFHPIIADFVATDPAPVARGKEKLPLYEWERVIELGPQYLAQRAGVRREGNPYRSMIAARVD